MLRLLEVALSAIDRSTQRNAMKTALVVIDLINPFNFKGAAALMRQTKSILPAMRRLLHHARRVGAPVVYCNDNFGQWRSNFHANIEACAGEGAAGSELIRQVLPAPGDYFVLKPRHSAFFKTPLDLLLDQLDIRRLVMIGIAADSCVLATAIDAHMHGYEVAVVSDAVASQTSARTRRALDLLRIDNPIRVIRTRAALRWLE
jgi:nicotinamidase-related amidase